MTVCRWHIPDERRWQYADGIVSGMYAYGKGEGLLVKHADLEQRIDGHGCSLRHEVAVWVSAPAARWSTCICRVANRWDSSVSKRDVGGWAVLCGGRRSVLLHHPGERYHESQTVWGGTRRCRGRPPACPRGSRHRHRIRKQDERWRGGARGLRADSGSGMFAHATTRTLPRREDGFTKRVHRPVARPHREPWLPLTVRASHRRSRGDRRRCAASARSVAALAPYRCSIVRERQPVMRMRSVSAPPSESHWCANV